MSSLCYETEITFREFQNCAMLFSEVIFGPVKSRRFGVSLGVNLLPVDNKLCNFECIYCECGWTAHRGEKVAFTDRLLISASLRSKLIHLQNEGTHIDSITFAGNGEPTMHPEFAGIMDDTVLIRNQFAPAAQIVVLSNAMLADREIVRIGIMKANRRILKLDAGDAELFRLINGPESGTAFSRILSVLESYSGLIEVQTMFLKAEYDGVKIDNTTPESVAKWLAALQRIKPSAVQIYSVDRKAPLHSVEQVGRAKLEEIAAKVRGAGIHAEVF